MAYTTKKLFLFFLLIVATGPTEAQEMPKQSIITDVVYLASDFLQGRATGTEGETKAAEYLAWRFQNLGLKPVSDSSWFQKFTFDYSPNPHGIDTQTVHLQGKNVLAIIDHQADSNIVVGAHYDHLGFGGVGSLHIGEKMIHNGADDNASGVAALLYIAEKLATVESSYNYIIAGFSGEEYGLVGSKYYLRELDSTFAIKCMINLDMVGRLSDDRTITINGVGTSPDWVPQLDQINCHDIHYISTESGIGASDHSAFYLKKIPAIHFFTGAHSEYHKPGDDSELINFSGIQMIGDYILALLKKIENSEMAFTKTKDDTNRTSTSFKVSLGIMPDYVFQGEGLRVDAVIEGRPGQKAGLQAGDIIVKMGEYDIKDIYQYMEALNKFEPGSRTEIQVKRNSESDTLLVDFK